MAQHVSVREYDPAWEEMFKTEEKLIRKILGNNCKAVHHIGSTAVEGLPAKPIIDIMPVVEDLEAVDFVADLFEQAGYEYMGEFGIPGRRYLRKGGIERTHQVHIFSENNESGSLDIERHLAVRDYLRSNKQIAQEYGALKIRLAKKYPYDIEGYCDGKDSFVQNLERTALKWNKDRSDWKKMYDAANAVRNGRKVSPQMEAGGVSAALLSDTGKVYVGVCIDSCCGLGMCAERNAAANMITMGEQRITKLVAIMPDGEVGAPCGACREFLVQMDKANENAEVLMSYGENKTVTLKDLTPCWWI